MDNMGSFSQGQWSTWAYNGVAYPYTQLPSYAAYLPESMEIYSAHQRHMVHHQMSRATESKPRLSKEEVEVLEAEFLKNHKPSSSTKKTLAEQMRVDNARINNWFQNRRAREKKERNIREYAAKQKLEKDTVSSEYASSPIDERHKDLVASSAPFPDVRRSSKASIESSSLSSTLTTPVPGYESESADDIAIYSSPDGSQHAANDDLVSSHMKVYSTVQSQQQRNEDILLRNSGSLVSLDERSFYGNYPQLIIPSGEDDAAHSFPPCLSEDGSVHGSDDQYQQADFSMGIVSQTDSMSPEVVLKSPPSIDLASRRNRRPPHLAISSSRSFSVAFPKTGLDVARRSDKCGTMRRVVSATGTGRISKNSAIPRSPFYERSPETLLQLNRSYNLPIGNGSVAPLTPNTPVIVDQSSVGEITPSYSLVVDKKCPPGLAVQDPTLRTPPTTPDMIENMFSMDSAYSIAVSDEPLITASLSSFPPEFELPGIAGIPNYITNGCSSQPQNPSYAPQMGPSYFGYSGANTEYNWCDASMSANSSPGARQRHVHFMNMTQSNFSHIER